LVSESEVLARLSKVMDPELGRDIVSLGMVRDLRVEGDRVSFVLELTTPACPYNEQIISQAKASVHALPGVKTVDMRVTARVPHGISAQGPLSTVRNVVAVASGKGGVGKTTISVNLAVGLARLGARTGILDADIYGPNVPLMLRSQVKPTIVNRRVVPAVAHGVKVMSLGLFILDDSPLIWRGPMVANAVRQMLQDVEWGELDYLIVDLPPGTGDAALTLAQTIPLTGVVIVTTPQDAAVGIATKALQMFRRLGIDIIGVVENMSQYVCPHCGKRDDVFGRGGGRRVAKELDAWFLGEIPLNSRIRQQSDAGTPIVLTHAPEAAAFLELAKAVAARVSVLAYQRSRPEGQKGRPESPWAPRF